MIEYSIVRSKRKTMALQITREGQVVVRCPLWVSDARAREFAESHRSWIEKHCEEIKEQISRQPVYTEEEVKAYREKAREVLSEKTAWWAERMGITYGRISIRQQATRWGSCSGKGNLNYNWKLVLLPEDLQDYVVVHELAHRKEMNHSSRFWEIVKKELPDWEDKRRRLRDFKG